MMNRNVVAALACLLLASCDNGPGTAVPSAVGTTAVVGRVLERLDAPPFSFLRLKTESAEVWVAIPIARIEPGAVVSMTNGVPMRRYEEKRAGRVFDLVYFGTLAAAPR